MEFAEAKLAEYKRAQAWRNPYQMNQWRPNNTFVPRGGYNNHRGGRGARGGRYRGNAGSAGGSTNDLDL